MLTKGCARTTAVAFALITLAAIVLIAGMPLLTSPMRSAYQRSQLESEHQQFFETTMSENPPPSARFARLP
jgi:hypothetical protein